MSSEKITPNTFSKYDRSNTLPQHPVSPLILLLAANHNTITVTNAYNIKKTHTYSTFTVL